MSSSQYLALAETSPGKSKSFEGRHRDVVCAADAGFEHATAPNRNVVFTTDLLDSLRLRVSADASELEIDYASCAESDRVPRIVAGTNRFVEANRRRNLFLQFGMIEDVVVSQRLFDHHQVEVVHLFEKRDVGKRVSRIRIGHQANRQETSHARAR